MPGRGNTGPGGSLDCDVVEKALLNYRNTPDRDLGISPAQIVFGRSVRDAVPMEKRKFMVSHNWSMKCEEREERLQKRMWDKHTKELRKLEIGGRVQIQ